MREPKIGDTLWYRAFGGEVRKVKVTDIDMEGKNGSPVFDGKTMGGDRDGVMVWGYFSQITRFE